MRVVAIILLCMLAAREARALVWVPRVCLELSERYGMAVPQVMTDRRAAAAAAKFEQVPDAVPGAKACRDALKAKGLIR